GPHHAAAARSSLSVAGSRVSELAIPPTAVLLLEATPAQLGLLGAAEQAPLLLVGLLAGAWADRLPRRPGLRGTAAGRAPPPGAPPGLERGRRRGRPAGHAPVVRRRVPGGALGAGFEAAYGALLPVGAQASRGAYAGRPGRVRWAARAAVAWPRQRSWSGAWG